MRLDLEKIRQQFRNQQVKLEFFATKEGPGTNLYLLLHLPYLNNTNITIKKIKNQPKFIIVTVVVLLG